MSYFKSAQLTGRCADLVRAELRSRVTLFPALTSPRRRSPHRLRRISIQLLDELRIPNFPDARITMHDKWLRMRVKEPIRSDRRWCPTAPRKRINHIKRPLREPVVSAMLYGIGMQFVFAWNYVYQLFMDIFLNQMWIYLFNYYNSYWYLPTYVEATKKCTISTLFYHIKK